MAFATLKAALRRSAPGAATGRAGDGSGGWPAADVDGTDPLDTKPPAPPPKNDAPASTQRSSRPLPAASLRGPTRRSTAMTHALDERPIKAPGMLALHNIPSSSSLDLASPDGPEAISISKSSLLSAAARLLSWQRSLSPDPDTPPSDAASAPVLDEAGSAHQQRIAEIQAAFVGGQVLASAHRQFVLEGTLVKVCRKANKARRFFLFNDLLVYGTPLPTKRLGNQTILPLSYISIVSLPDEPPDVINAFQVFSQRKSFVVMAATPEEKAQWIEKLTFYANQTLADADTKPNKGRDGVIEFAPAWAPDSSATHCSLCHNVRFTTFNRRHHCRQCGRVVCAGCSDHFVPIPSAPKRQNRVCDECFAASIRSSFRRKLQPSMESSAARLAWLCDSDSDSDDEGAEVDDRRASQQQEIRLSPYHRTYRVHGI